MPYFTLSRLLSKCLVLTAGIAVAPVCANATSLDENAEHYRAYLVESIDQSLKGAFVLQERVAAEDLPGAKLAWISARAGWERSEIFTGGFVPELDEKIDSWPNATTGFHAIEARLFGADHTDVKADTDTLVENLNDLHKKARDIRLTPQGLLNGTAQLAYEVGESKADGGESRISGTSLDDMRNNAVGVATAYDVIFASAIENADPKLAQTARRQIDELKSLLAVPSLKKVDTQKLTKVTEELVVSLQTAAPEIGLKRPTLESTP